MDLKLEKKDYSKLKNKSIAVITKNNIGNKFGLLLDEMLDIDVEIYKVNSDESFYMANSLIRELNNDEDVLMIMVVKDDVLEALVSHKKVIKCEYPSRGISTNGFELHKELVFLNIGRINKRLKEL